MKKFNFNLPSFVKNYIHKLKQKGKKEFSYNGDDTGAHTKPQITSNKKLQKAAKQKAQKAFEFFTPQMIHKTFVYTSLVTVSWGTGNIASQQIAKLGVFDPPKSKSKPIPRLITGQGSVIDGNDIASINRMNLFNAVDKKPESDIKKMAKKDLEPKKIETGICYSATSKSSLPYTLENTTVMQNKKKSVAVLKAKGEFVNYREGDIIDKKLNLSQIEKFKIIFRNLQSGKCEYLVTKTAKKINSRKKYKILSPSEGKNLLSKKMKGIKNNGNNFNISKKLRNSLLSDISNILTQARAIQIKNPDGSLSFKITDIEPGSIYSFLNISDGDIITGLNGKKINSLNDIMSVFGKLNRVERLNISVKRNGNEDTMFYQFDDE